MAIRKAVIPAAGWGTRFLPASKAAPKEVFAIIDRPAIQYAIEEALAAGIRDIVLVTSTGKEAIERYFKPHPELEAFLERKGDHKRLEQVRGVGKMVNITPVIQHEQLGLGHAVLMAKQAIGNEFFAVFLPDDVIEAETPAIKQLLSVHERPGGSVIAVSRVPDDEVSRYGVIDGSETAPRTHRVRRLVEKPKREDAPSNLAVIGRYILSPRIFHELERVKPGAIGEIQLTDAIDALIRDEAVYAYEFEGELLDAGTPIGLLKASVRMGLKRPDIAPEFKRWLREQIASLQN
ncbi:MAG: UTP--glucose-1-phosphate uridylyltransferase [Chloroflexi bacterium]|nr:UTP--glucose-1-phosphate uridylyltransferase [Chloroflexota bacterium]